jgi:hypothetical protein
LRHPSRSKKLKDYLEWTKLNIIYQDNEKFKIINIYGYRSKKLLKIYFLIL